MIDEKSQETILVPHALGNIIHVGPIMRLNLCIKSRCMRARQAGRHSALLVIITNDDDAGQWQAWAYTTVHSLDWGRGSLLPAQPVPVYQHQHHLMSTILALNQM